MRTRRLLLGMLAGNAVGVLLLGVACGLVHLHPGSALVVSLPGLLLVPFVVGLAAAWVWKPLELGVSIATGQSAGHRQDVCAASASDFSAYGAAGVARR